MWLSTYTALSRTLLKNPRMLAVSPRLNFFLIGYLRKFKIRKVAGRLVVHSHLPPLNSKAYSRFVSEHLLGRSAGPSHAQIGVTNACPQRCAYCYNRYRKGRPLDTTAILRTIADLKAMGVFWLGLTGGEPLLNQDLARIIESAGPDCAVKLFTTGCTLTRQRAVELQRAGLYSVSVSLDHWQEDVHDGARGYPGAFSAALTAIDLFKEAGGLHVGVSAVLSKDMIAAGQVVRFLEFLQSLDIHEAWLSEAKPSTDAFWNDSKVLTESERLELVRLQDEYNARGRMTVNYLGHFEGREHFGCNAGHKMVYVDAFGEVSPCVFTPMTFGNVREESLKKIFQRMKPFFPSENTCFVNKNFALLRRYGGGLAFVEKDAAMDLMAEVRFDPLAEFFRLFYGGAKRSIP